MSIFKTKQTAGNPRYISHRGFTPLAPENSLPAFYYAGQLNQWAIETDVHLSKDGVLVCCHNETVEAMYGEQGSICQMSSKELSRLRIRTGNRLACFNKEELRMPLFSEYLEICRHYHSVPFIELKTGDVAWVLKAVKAAGINEDEVVMSSANLSWLEETRKKAPGMFIHHIFSNEIALERLTQLGNAGVSWKIEDPWSCSKEFADDIHQMDVKVCLRAGDSWDSVQKMMELGLDYIPTNTMHARQNNGK